MDIGTLVLTVLAWVMVFILCVAAFCYFRGMDESGNRAVANGVFSSAYLFVATVILAVTIGGPIATIICAIFITILIAIVFRTIVLALYQRRYRRRHHV